MIKILYIVYGAVVLIGSTMTNLSYMSQSGSNSSNWNTHSSGSSYGGSGGSTGGFSSSGGHK